MIEKFRLFTLTFTLYFAHPIFKRLYNRWHPDESNMDGKPESARKLYRRFWYKFFLLFIIIFLTTATLFFSGIIDEFKIGYLLRIVAALIAATAAISRGGWGIQTMLGNTIIEKIDQFMFDISQVGAVVILILAFSL